MCLFLIIGSLLLVGVSLVVIAVYILRNCPYFTMVNPSRDLKGGDVGKRSSPGRVVVSRKKMGCCGSKSKKTRVPKPRVQREACPNLALSNNSPAPSENSSSSDDSFNEQYGPPPENLLPMPTTPGYEDVETQGNCTQSQDQDQLSPVQMNSSDPELVPLSDSVQTDRSEDIPILFSLPRSTFKRLVQGYIHKYDKGRSLRLGSEAADALQVASENYLISIFQDSKKVCAHRRRKTVSIEDMKLVLDIRRDVHFSLSESNVSR